MKKLTPQIRTALKYQGKPPTNTNLLAYRMDLIIGSQKITVIESDSILVSGWPSRYAQETLSEKFPNNTFQFISSMIPDFDTLDIKCQGSALGDRLSIGYCLDKESLLISERLSHQKDSLKRAQKEIPHLSQRYLHTEQGLMLYLASKEVQDKLKAAIENLTLDNNEKQEIACVVNLASSRSVCINCADRLFRESEWGMGFFT